MTDFRTFLADTRASVTHLAAIAMLPLAGTLGLAVDYARTAQAKSEIQGALDSTVLMLTREAPKKDVAALKKLADPYFNALIASKRPEYVSSGISVQKTDKDVSASTRTVVPTFFGGLYAWLEFSGNTSAFTIDSASTAAYGTKKIELALVLDNTGSMASANKIVELKKASHTLLTMLQSAATAPDQVKVAVVPYTTQVRLDTTYKNANWLTTTPTGTFVGGAGYNIPASRDLWDGCIADRDTGYNADTKAVSVPVAKSLYPMVNCSGGIARMMPLSANWSALHARIDEMKASGMTNITLGAQWGYEMLSANAPFTEASADPNVERFMVLLTDGQNTQDRWGLYNESRQNKDTQAMCDAIVERNLPAAAKKLKIKLYTVLVINGNESLLKNCASDPSMYSKVNQASELEAVFRKIAKDIGTIHLTM